MPEKLDDERKPLLLTATSGNRPVRLAAALICGLLAAAGIRSAASAACVSEPTPTCLLADAQVAAMAMTDTRGALADFAFTGWAQSVAGDGAGARDTLRVAELRALGADPAALANYHAGMAGIWAVLGEAARAKAAIAAARAALDATDPYGRVIALADVGYAEAFLDGGGAAAAAFAGAIEAARGPDGDAFLIAYVAWNEVLTGSREAGLAATQEALGRLGGDSTLTLWTVGYAALIQSMAGDAAAAATRDRLRRLASGAASDEGRLETTMMLAWSLALAGEQVQAEALVREQLPAAYAAADRNRKSIALTYAALALAPKARLGP